MTQAAKKQPETTSLTNNINRYTNDLSRIMSDFDWTPVHELANDLLRCWIEQRQFFICGNGGSAANALHIANDFLYGISKTHGKAIKCHALSANNAIMTCLANDTGYDNIFAGQLSVLGNPGDVLLVMSGSGNSPNIIQAIKSAKEMGIKSYGILGYCGGKAKEMVDTPIHFEINDMQISEDMQIIVSHIISQWLYQNKHLV